MLSVTQRRSILHSSAALRALGPNPLRAASSKATPKREGDISDAFASLSGLKFGPLDPRFAEVKEKILEKNKDALQTSWVRLLASLREEIPQINAKRSSIIPEINFSDIGSGNVSTAFKEEHRKRGVAIVRDVIPDEQVLGWKEELKDYIRANPHTKAFPADNPQVFELYWSPAQVKGRSHPNMLTTQRFLMEFWHSRDPEALISPSHPTMYADRVRIRQPGDAKFALGPHVDGGSCERWEEEGYGRGGVYDEIWRGNWEHFDPWEASSRLPVNADMYDGVGACGMFRMYQGWLSMSETGPFNGTLLVNPLLSQSTAYFLLRPFFSPKKAFANFANMDEHLDFLAASNWQLDSEPTSWLHGATPGHGQELRHELHPHLDLPNSMVHIPEVKPGDYVSWHCDTIHAVDQVHRGTNDSSVLYIPCCPLTEGNARFLAKQKRCFLEGTPCPDFGGGVGESRHVGRPGPRDVKAAGGVAAQRAWGLLGWDSNEPGLSPGQKSVMELANRALVQ